MSRKNTLVTTLVSGHSLSASFTTSPTVVRYLDNCSYQIDVTTTNSAGTFVVEASNNYYVNEGNNNVVVNPGTWIPLNIGGSPTVAGAPDTILINLNQLPFYALRIGYTAVTPGTGTCDISITHKQIGG